jgi:hypothetical protein
MYATCPVHLILFDMIIVIMIELFNDSGAHAVAYLIEALCYKPEGHGLDS